jgi:hypothetical protein
MLNTAIFAQGTNQLGIEGYLLRRARANHKPVLGLESFREHAEVLSGMSDKQAELVLVDSFVVPGERTISREKLMADWRAGNVDALARADDQKWRDLPSFHKRLVADRNRNWLPKIEDYLQHHRNYFVVVGAAHLGGANGVLALLRARGYAIQQL